MSEKYVVRLKNAAIYHADNPFGSTSAEKLMRRGEMVLSDVNLCVAPGEFVYLIGRVGSGKSTLLKTLYAEVQLLTGEGRVAGYDLRRLRRRDIPHLRRRIGIVFKAFGSIILTIRKMVTLSFFFARIQSTFISLPVYQPWPSRMVTP